MNYQAIHDLIESDENLDWSSTDAELSAAINAMDGTPEIRPLGSALLLEWAAINGVFIKLDAACADPETPTQVLAIAKPAKLLIERDGTSLDLSKPAIVALVDGLVAAGLMTSDDKTSLLALATVTPKYASQTLGGFVTFTDVARARARRVA